MTLVSVFNLDMTTVKNLKKSVDFGKIMSDNKTLQEQCYGECWGAQQRIEELEAQIIQLRYRQDIHDNLIKRMQQEGKPEQGVDDIVNKHFWDLT